MMRTAIPCILTLAVTLVSAPRARAQAGRYIPMPRLPSGGGSSHFIPHIFPHGSVGDDIFWIIVVLIGAGILVFIGWHLGQAIGRWFRPPPEQATSSGPLGPTGWQATTPPPMKDLILQPAEVVEKAKQTRRLMEFLAHRDHAVDPGELHKWIAMTFVLVQKAWEARDYGTIGDLLMPGIRAKHEGLLKSMRENHEINRIDDLRIERLEFVHLHCPRLVDLQEVTALITFQASVYFVHDRTGAHTRGARTPSWFQEFWTFRRRGERWLLQAIEQSHESNRLQQANHVAELTERQMENAQHSIAL